MTEPPEGTAKRSDRPGGTDGASDRDHPNRRGLSRLDARLSAVERAVADGAASPPVERPGVGELAERLATVEVSLATVEARLDDLDAATQALRGYVGGVRAVDRGVERRADAALAAVDRLEEDFVAGGDGDVVTPELDTDRHGTVDSDGVGCESTVSSDDESRPTGIAERLRDAL